MLQITNNRHILILFFPPHFIFYLFASLSLLCDWLPSLLSHVVHHPNAVYVPCFPPPFFC
jgi:hypothetical protein